MQSLRHGFTFLKQSWQMVLDDRNLVMPSILALFAGILVTLAGSLPVILAFRLFGERGFGQVVRRWEKPRVSLWAW